MPMSPAKGKEEWLKDLQGITSKTEHVNKLASILAQKSKRLSEALNQALTALHQRMEELVRDKLNSKESDHEWQLMKVALTAATAQTKMTIYSLNAIWRSLVRQRQN